MRTSYSSIFLSLIKSGLLAASAYLVLERDALVYRNWGLDLSNWAWPFYLCAALLLGAQLVRQFGKGRWIQAVAVLLPRIGFALVVFGAVSALSSLVFQLETHPEYAAVGRTLKPYVAFLKPVGILLTLLIMLAAVYKAVTPMLMASSWGARLKPSAFGSSLLPTDLPRTVITNSLFMALVYLLLDPNGLINLIWGLDLGGLQAPFYTFFSLRMASDLTLHFGRGLWRDSVSSLLFWAGLTQLTYFVLGSVEGIAIQLKNSTRYADVGEMALPYMEVIGGVDLWAIFLLGLMGIYESSAPYWKQARYNSYTPLIQATVMLLLGWISWRMLEFLSSIGQHYSTLGVVAFSAFVAMSAGYLATYTGGNSQPIIARFSLWAAESPFRNANVGAFAALYALIIRPALYGALVYAPLIEWAGVVLVGVYVVQASWGSIKNLSNETPPHSVGRGFDKHKQAVSAVSDPALEPVLRAQHSFVNSGRRSAMVAYVVTTLWENEVPVEHIAKAIEIMVNHVDPQKPRWSWFTSAFLRRPSSLFQAQIEQSRRGVLQQIQEDLEALRPSAQGFYKVGKREAGVSTPRAQALWSWAEESFVETGDLTRLAVVVAIETRESKGSRSSVADSLDRVFQYRASRPTWYQSKSQRQRLAEHNRGLRQDFFNVWRAATE